MSFHVGPIATANHFIGLAANIQRGEITEGIRAEDDRRQFWIRHMLPLLTEEFLDKVVASPATRCKFHLPGLDDINAEPKHMVVFQSFAHLAVPLKTLPTKQIPWQFRFILDESVCPVLYSSLQTNQSLRSEVFEKAGWVFWITKTGFCITPKYLCDELSDANAVYDAWLKTRNDAIEEVQAEAPAE